MEKLSFRTSADKNGRIEMIEIGGLLVLETALDLKDELVGVVDRLSNKVKITFFEIPEMDLSGVQLLVAFIRKMDKMKVGYQIDWKLDQEQKTLFVNVGIGIELFMN
jgi:ABC-type transporter Mla MlaB component